MTGLRAFWQRRSRWGKALLIVAAVFVGLIALGVAFGEDEPTAEAPVRTVTETVERESPPPPEPEPPPAPQPAPPDSGRMSEGEFDSFRSAQAKVVDEALQFTAGVEKCSVIGQAGQLAEFSDCMDESYSGFEEDVSQADFVAEDYLDDTAKQCRAALRTYRLRLRQLASAYANLHETGANLDIDAMPAASRQSLRASRRYRKYALNALRACEPR